MSHRAEVRVLPVAAQRLLLVCGKCSRKLDGGFGDDGDRSLTKMLRRALPNTKGKRATTRVLETKCLDICPKRAVVLVDSRHPGEVLLVAGGTPVVDVVAHLDGPGGPPTLTSHQVTLGTS